MHSGISLPSARVWVLHLVTWCYALRDFPNNLSARVWVLHSVQPYFAPTAPLIAYSTSKGNNEKKVGNKESFGASLLLCSMQEKSLYWWLQTCKECMSSLSSCTIDFLINLSLFRFHKKYMKGTFGRHADWWMHFMACICTAQQLVVVAIAEHQHLAVALTGH